MYFFENEHFLKILKAYKPISYPMLAPIVNHLSENHWHKIMLESFVDLKSILCEIDPLAYEENLRYKNKLVQS